MFNIVRKIVAGPKNRTVDQHFDLDLTYITPLIIAMAFPASGLQKTYRNSITDVSRFLSLQHGNQHYLIVNASNRKYNYAPFNNQVVEYFWTDHQAPPITTLFQLCEQVHQFLQKSDKNVAAIHCNHGKGRTGTAIISYLLFSGQFNDVKTALTFYNKKRFKGGKLSVDQPCQLRYLRYFQSFLQLPVSYLSQPLKAFKLIKANHTGPKDKDFFIRISQTRTQHIIYPQIQMNGSPIQFSRPLIGDIFIQVLEDTWAGKKQLIRINYNLFFLSRNVDNKTFQVRFIGQEMKMNRVYEDFQLILEFEEFCHCDKHLKEECICVLKRQREQGQWRRMVEIIVKNKQRQIKEHNNLSKLQQQNDNQDQMQEHVEQKSLTINKNVSQH